ncbi:MAG: ABC transporter permease [Alphaproteobacteria bacterium]|nr:MAG: ABC transporter permease [Alphaproteobacteria bacterium]
MRLFLSIALRHLLARKRQSLVSLAGIIIGVGFFLAISSLMQGSQKDFIKRLVDNAPHITISDTYRDPRLQPAERVYAGSLVGISRVKPLTEVRGIRGYRQIIERLHGMPGVRSSAVLTGQALLSFAGRDQNIVLNGMTPAEIRDITTIEENMKEGSIDDLIANRNGIIVGTELMRTMSLNIGENVTLAASTGQVHTFKIVGVFRTGRSDYDMNQAFADIKKVQAITNRSQRANTIIIKLDDPNQSREVAADLESSFGYKAVSWQESFEDLMNTLVIRNVIMYSVVSAVLIVAAFGIYNVISTIVLEKHRDIAILKSMGFRATDVRRIFVIQGLILGVAGTLLGMPFGSVLMVALSQVSMKPPGVTEAINIPVDWSPVQFLIAASFAMSAAFLASWLPARKGARLLPVDILRGGQ